ncbi:unnamed protein product [Peniophora sp. CBMAI 1063]|nr:unnamed protein product [Peniophora sp. CBMAI 1063]
MDLSALTRILADKPIPTLFSALASSAPGASDESLQSILDAELSRRTQQLRDLQVFRNRIASPATRLPPEILSEIFLNLAGESDYGLSWRRYAFVSRTWLDAALNTPALWSFVDLTRIRTLSVLRRFLDRAKDSPLSVDITVRSQTRCYWADGEPLFWHDRQLRALKIDIQPNLVVSFLDRIVFENHPRLESMRIIAIPREVYGGDRPPVPEDYIVVRLPFEFFLERTPLLRRLFLVNISFDWSTLRNLTHLKVLWSREWSEQYTVDWTLRDIAEALIRCPQLTRVVMRPLPVAELDVPLSPVNLPCLSDLEFIGFAESCGQLLTALKMPSSTTLNIDATRSGDNFNISALEPLIAGLQRHYTGSTSLLRTMICSMVHVENRGESLCFHFYEEARLHPRNMSYEERSKSYLLTLYTYPRTREAMCGLISLLLSVMPFHNILYLDWRGTSSVHSEAKATIMENLPALEAIAVYLREEDVDCLLETLAIYSQRGNGWDEGCIYIDAGCLQWNTPEELQAAHILLDRVVAHAAEANLSEHPLKAIVLFAAPKTFVDDIDAQDVARSLSLGFKCNEVLYTYTGEGEGER